MANNSNFIHARVIPLLLDPERAAQQRSVVIPWRMKEYGSFSDVQVVMNECGTFYPAAAQGGEGRKIQICLIGHKY